MLFFALIINMVKYYFSLPVLHLSARSLKAHLPENVKTMEQLVGFQFDKPYSYMCRGMASTINN